MTQLQQLLQLYALLRRRMDAERQDFTNAAARAVRDALGHQNPTTPADHHLIQNALGPVYDEWYGRAPGDERGRFFVLTAAMGSTCWRLAAERERAMVTQTLKGEPELLAMVSRDSHAG